MEKRKTKILLVDDHQLVMDGLARIFEKEEGFTVLAKVNSGKEALRILNNEAVDVLITDMEMPQMTGLELVTKVKELKPNLRVIVLSMYSDRQLVKKMIKQGVDGYVLKNSCEDEIVLAVKRVKEGNQYFSALLTQSLLGKSAENHESQTHDLSEREVEVLQLIAEGYNTREIADQLHISKRTVDNHRANMLKKLEAKNVAALIRYGIKNGLID